METRDDPHLLSVRDVIEQADSLWVVMDPVQPRSLHSLLRDQRRLGATAVANIGLEVARALEMLHEAGTAHGQVSPHGIFFRPDGTAALAGYGFAPPEPDEQPLVYPWRPTSQYTAPELIGRRAKHPPPPTPQGDRWALGVTLYEMVEGRSPLRGPVPLTPLKSLRDARPPRVHREKDFAPLIEGLLSPRPDARTAVAAAAVSLDAVAGRREPVYDSHWAVPTRARRTRCCGQAGTQGADDRGNERAVHGRLPRTRPVPHALPHDGQNGAGLLPISPTRPAAQRRGRALRQYRGGMGNVFHGGNRSLYMSNGGTEVFVDVLMLAVSELAARPWDYRFAALLTLQDQNVMGRGAVGFDLEDIEWGGSPKQQAEAKDFVLRVLDLALRRHRWDELGYDPPFAQDYLRQYREMVEEFDPATAGHRGDTFPAPGEAARASCAQHRILSSLPHGEGCVLCVAPLRAGAMSSA